MNDDAQVAYMAILWATRTRSQTCKPYDVCLNLCHQQHEPIPMADTLNKQPLPSWSSLVHIRLQRHVISGHQVNQADHVCTIIVTGHSYLNIGEFYWHPAFTQTLTLILKQTSILSTAHMKKMRV
jgi:hypothetical protein